jgi:hypothetical protein
MTAKFKKTYTVGNTKVTLKTAQSKDLLDFAVNGVLQGNIEVINEDRFAVDGCIFDAVDKAGKWMAAQFAKVKPRKAWKPVSYIAVLTLEDIDDEGKALSAEIKRIREAEGNILDIFQSGFDNSNYAVIRVETTFKPETWMERYEATDRKNGYDRD